MMKTYNSFVQEIGLLFFRWLVKRRFNTVQFFSSLILTEKKEKKIIEVHKVAFNGFYSYWKSQQYLTRMKMWHAWVIFLLSHCIPYFPALLLQASIKGILEVHLRKFLIINSAMGNNSHKFTSNALSQWSNERYFANNWPLSSYCALKGGKERWLSELWHCASISRPLSRRTGLPGTQELAGINEDAKVTPRLLALMARHTTLRQSTQDAIWHYYHRNFWGKTLAQAGENARVSHLLPHTCTRLLIPRLSASLANSVHPFQSQSSGDQAWVIYRSTHKSPSSICLTCHWHSKSLSHACIHNGPITANGDPTPCLTITSVRVWER